MAEAEVLNRIDETVHGVKKDLSHANNKLDEIIQAQHDLRDGQDSIIETQAEQRGMLRNLSTINSSLVGINENTKIHASNGRLLTWGLLGFTGSVLLLLAVFAFVIAERGFGGKYSNGKTTVEVDAK